MQKLKETTFIKQWLNRNVGIMKLIHPEISKKKLTKIALKTAMESAKGTEITIHNNYSDREMKMDLIDLYEWIQEKTPILTESGVMFKNQEQAPNPASGMLRSQRDSRNDNKRKRDEHEYGSEMYNLYDTLQNDDKVDMNSYYGGSGAKSSIFFNIYIASSTTLKGRNLISTAAMSFENFLANSVKFYNLDECLNYVYNILEEDYRNDIITKDMLEYVDIDKLLKSLSGKFAGKVNDNNMKLIEKVITNLSEEDRAKVYYKNNLYKYITTSKPRVYMEQILSIMDKEEFLDPTNPPENIQRPINKLWDLCSDAVHYNYVIPDRVERLSFKMERESVVIVDTDSNMLNMMHWLEFVKDEFDADNDKRIEIINICARLCTSMIKNHLELYCDNCNVLPKHYKVIDMKNEYYYERMMCTPVKKRYAGAMRRNEDKILDKPKLDMKGMSIRKSETNKYSTEYLTNILEEDILYNDLDPGRVLEHVGEFEDSIVDKISNGDLDVIRPTSVKPAESYKYPWRMPQLRGVIAWNHLYPKKKMQLPVKCYLLKVKIRNREELQRVIDKYPKYGNILKEKIFDGPNEKLAKHGVKVICIPKTESKIPKWMRDFANKEAIVRDNSKSFNNPQESIGFLPIQTKGSNDTYGNIIEF